MNTLYLPLIGSYKLSFQVLSPQSGILFRLSEILDIPVVEEANVVPGAWQLSAGAWGRIRPENLTPLKQTLFARRALMQALLPLLLEGRFFLVHGAAVARDRHGMLLCGRSGVGKSTAARRLAERYQVLADDCLLVYCRDDGSYEMQGLPTWSMWTEGKEGVHYHCRGSASVERLFLLDRGNNESLPLNRQEALLGLLPALSDMILWNYAHIDKDSYRSLMLSACRHAAQLVNGLPPRRLCLNLNGTIFNLLGEHDENQSANCLSQGIRPLCNHFQS